MTCRTHLILIEPSESVQSQTTIKFFCLDTERQDNINKVSEIVAGPTGGRWHFPVDTKMLSRYHIGDGRWKLVSPTTLIRDSKKSRLGVSVRYKRPCA